MALTKDQVRILAQTLLGEAGGEGLDGMKAVAHVIKNRAASGRFPNDPVSVAMQPQQFSTWNEGQGGNNPGRYGPGSPGYEEAVKAVEAVFNGNDPDPTGGATHYWSPRGMQAMGYAADPYWAKSEETEFGRKQIGNHVFLPRENPAVAAIDRATAPVPMPPLPAGMRATGEISSWERPDGSGRTYVEKLEDPDGGKPVYRRVPAPPVPASADERVTARNRVAAAPDFIPRIDQPIRRPDLADVGNPVIVPNAPAGDFAYTLPGSLSGSSSGSEASLSGSSSPPPVPMPPISEYDRRMQVYEREYGDLSRRLDAMDTPPAPPPPVELPQTGTGNFGDPIRPPTPMEIEAGSGFRLADRGAPPDRLPASDPGMPFDYEMPAIVPMPRPRPATGLQVGIAPPGFTPYPARQQRAFGDAPTLPGRLGLLQTMAGSALNPSGPERRQINNRMTSIFNPGIQSSQAVRDEARRTGNHSTLQRGDRRYDPDSNSWRVK